MNWLNHDHLDHELLLQDCQAAAEQEDWKGVKRAFEKLVTGIKSTYSWKKKFSILHMKQQ